MEKIKYGIGKNPNSHHKGKRKYKVNDNFFETPNLINSYYAGFIAADGCIRVTKTGAKYLMFGLSIKDKCLLENIKKDLNFEGPITEYPKLTKKFVRLIINSPKICEDLEKNFNITPRKTFTLIPPNINKTSLIDAFICGYIDGDGTICFSHDYKNGKQKKCCISLIGTFDFLTWINNRFKEIYTPKNKNSKNKKPFISKSGFGNKRKDDRQIFTISFSDKWARNIILNMTQYSIPFLKRKWSDEIINFCKNYKKRRPVCRQKGVNIFNLNGDLITKCSTLEEANNITNVTVGRISALCKQDNSKHMSKGFMFSRTKTEMNPYSSDNYFAIKHKEIYTN